MSQATTQLRNGQAHGALTARSTARVLAAFAALCACAQAARAEFVVYSIKDDWLNAVPSAITSIGAPNIPTGQAAVWSLLRSHGVRTTSVSSRPLQPWEAPYWDLPVGTNVLTHYPSSFTFDAPITSFAMEVQATGPELMLLYAVYGQNGYMGSFQIPTNNIPGPRFFGIISTQPFRQIFGDASDGSGMMRSLMFTQIVPAPGAMAVFAGLLVRGGRRRR